MIFAFANAVAVAMYVVGFAETVVELAQDLEPLKGTEEESLDEALLRTIALSSAGTLSPMAAIMGGVAAQEVLKVGTCGERERLGKRAGSVCARGHPYPEAATEHVTNPAVALRWDPRGVGIRSWQRPSD